MEFKIPFGVTVWQFSSIVGVWSLLFYNDPLMLWLSGFNIGIAVLIFLIHYSKWRIDKIKTKKEASK